MLHVFTLWNNTPKWGGRVLVLCTHWNPLHTGHHKALLTPLNVLKSNSGISYDAWHCLTFTQKACPNRVTHLTAVLHLGYFSLSFPPLALWGMLAAICSYSWKLHMEWGDKPGTSWRHCCLFLPTWRELFSRQVSTSICFARLLLSFLTGTW